MKKITSRTGIAVLVVLLVVFAVARAMKFAHVVHPRTPPSDASGR